MFTPLETTLGALLIQFATTSYLLTTGNTIGFSSLLFNLFNNTSTHNFSVVFGLLISTILTYYHLPDFIPSYDGDISFFNYIISGALVGFGTKFGCGCTSGHMINGLSRFRVRSIAATATFVSVAILTTNYLKLGDSCDGCCYQYDQDFTTFTNNKDKLLLILGSAFLTSYLILPLTTKFLAGSFASPVQFLNGLNAGLFFGLGLIISGMANPSKTLGFLSILQWSKFDPSLVLIIVFTIIPNYFIWNFFVLKRESAMSNQKFDLNFNNKIPKKFILGNVLFGLGWGSLGVCPGPGILGVVFNGLNGVSWAGSFLIFYKLASYL